jgi:hypothetical protein
MALTAFGGGARFTGAAGRAEANSTRPMIQIINRRKKTLL